MDKLIVKSPAKINIGLNIIRKKNDRYHDIETIFYPLLLSDILSFKKSNKTKLASNSNEVKNLDNNIIFEAIRILEEHSGKKLGTEIFLEKNIPIGAGLGGGSSNAAATLKAINHLYKLNLNYKTLSELALALGSDVPYFLNPVACYASSRGEILNKINLYLSQPILLLNPGINISTKWAFEQLTLSNQPGNLSHLSSQKIITVEDIKRFATNDFEDIVFKKYPEISLIKEQLYSLGAEFALMTGTGSTVYGIFSNLQKAKWAKEDFENKYFTFLNFPVDHGSIT